MKLYSFRPVKTARLLLLGALATGLSTAFAVDVPKNLGNGLDKLVQSNLALKNDKAARKNAALFNGYATEEAANMAAISIRDAATNRFLVDIHLDGRVPFAQLKQSLPQQFSSLTITASDAKYKNVGVIEGFIAIDQVAALANARGIISVQLGIKPYVKRVDKTGLVPRIGPVPRALTLIGTAFDQGVTQHRVDKINQIYNPSAPFNWDGSGMQIACMSDSFASSTSAYNTNVTAGDLPGPASPYNTTPVTVLQDTSGTDEGRGMCQIVYKMAPRAKIAFATANLGEVGFANNIRALAGLSGYTYPNQTFKADTICDDVGYYDEPIFEDGIIANGIDDVYAAGVSYFSSAANDIGTNGYESDFRWVAYTGGTTAADCPQLVGTNINLAGVPSELYAGGFHNFNPNPGQLDVAQTWAMPSSSSAPPTVLQWDDPYDQTTQAVLDQPALYHNTGTITSNTTITYSDIPALTAGQLYEVDEKATSGNFDGTVTIRDPSNNVVVSQDNTVDETVRFFAPVTGAGYSITIGRFSTTTGSFTVDLYHASGFGSSKLITTDVNVLGFNVATGAYSAAASLISNNFATNQPVDLAVLSRPSSAGIQFLVTRRNVPANDGNQPTHFRLKAGGNGLGGIGPLEYFTYNTSATGGHPTANGCNGSAAYSVFRPNIPEGFTSPGPARIYFDKQGNRLATPEIRLQPRVAAADRANQTWTSGDSSSDVDAIGNFSGTSAAAPHAAAIAGLVLQAHGGPGSVTPAQMTDILQRSAFPHDLDPMFVSGSARASNGGKITITVNSDSSSIAVPSGTNPALTTGGLGLQDVNSWTVSYVGPGYLTNLTFNPAGTAATAGSTTSGNNGVDASNNYFSNIYPGMVFLPTTKAFTLGSLNGLSAADITVPLSASPYTGFSNLAPAPSNGSSQFWTMSIGFPNANFTGGKSIHFTVGRGEQHSSAVGNGAAFNAGSTGGTTLSNPTADLLGGGVQIPEGTVNATGMAFSATVSDGTNTYPVSGTMTNRIGSGYSVLDGFGFINAETATSLPAQ